MPDVHPPAPPLPRPRPPIDPRPSESARRRLPLKSERMRIVVRGRLALVRREQVFRNDEDCTIEATVSFPVPVHATLCSLKATIDGRTLTATAQPRDQARETYEQAIEDGKTAVLHEELVRGVHVLSLAHIPPHTTIAVTHAWIAALSPRDGDLWSVRIPVTVGDIYGVSPFTDADDLAVSPDVRHEALLEVHCRHAVCSIAGVPLMGSRTVILDAPIDLDVAGTAETASGMAADGRSVRITVTADRGGDHAIDAAILVDRSGSMDGPAWTNGARWTKHAAVAAGLRAAAGSLRRSDRTELWEFDNSAEPVGPGLPLAVAADHLGAPRGGTEIGAALATVVGRSGAGDIILVTDGLSHDLDVQAIARSGRRFTVVLVGEDAFEANVGRLAALSGGQVFLVTRSSDAATAVCNAIASVRRPTPTFAPAIWPLEEVDVGIAGARVAARWIASEPEREEPEFATAVGAFAASIAVPRLSTEQARQIALGHGLVTHLTSLILVDDAGAVQSALPAQRKVPLMQARCSAPTPCAAPMPVVAAAAAPRMAPLPAPPPGGGRAFSAGRRSAPPRPLKLAAVARHIDWGADPQALRRGDLSGLDPELAARIQAASEVPEVAALTDANRDGVVIVIALLAKSKIWNRSAARIAKAVLAGLDAAAIARAMTALGLR